MFCFFAIQANFLSSYEFISFYKKYIYIDANTHKPLQIKSLIHFFNAKNIFTFTSNNSFRLDSFLKLNCAKRCIFGGFYILFVLRLRMTILIVRYFLHDLITFIISNIIIIIIIIVIISTIIFYSFYFTFLINSKVTCNKIFTFNVISIIVVVIVIVIVVIIIILTIILIIIIIIIVVLVATSLRIIIIIDILGTLRIGNCNFVVCSRLLSIDWLIFDLI